MLIDWVTACLHMDNYPLEFQRELMSHQDRVLRISGNGEIVWDTTAWDSIRSDSHQLAFRVTGCHVWIQGSPTRVIADGDNVFSAGAAASMDIIACVQRMAQFIGTNLSIDLFHNEPKRWQVTRIDVTQNLALASLPEVRSALEILAQCEGGRYRRDQRDGLSVYWSQRSKLRKGKAYAKGPHLLYLMKKKASEYTGRVYSLEEIALANKILRLELTLGSKFFIRQAEEHQTPWHQLTKAHLTQEWHSYFDRMIGGTEIMCDNDLKDRIFKAAPTEGQAKAAYGCWTLIKTEGFERAQEMQTRRTWYRNLSNLRNAGLSDSDFSTGQIVMLRRKVMELQAVDNWHQLRTVA